ncbi:MULTISPECIES: IS1 family transposase [Xenorhabdus]|uniref:IS1 family transposase n=1 Tax=Xenorhabdus TaxID=626 RepID=UPI003514151D
MGKKNNSFSHSIEIHKKFTGSYIEKHHYNPLKAMTHCLFTYHLILHFTYSIDDRLVLK